MTNLLRLLEYFAKAWNDHDVDALMACMADDCTFYSSSGLGPSGNAYRGRPAVRAAYAKVFEAIPNAAWPKVEHCVAADGQTGHSLWLFTGTSADGKSHDGQGCDIFRFEGGKIAEKNSFRKTIVS